jgi:hypothetical protein
MPTDSLSTSTELRTVGTGNRTGFMPLMPKGGVPQTEPPSQ